MGFEGGRDTETDDRDISKAQSKWKREVDRREKRKREAERAQPASTANRDTPS